MLGIASPTYADLGPADTSPKAEEPKQTKFDAWCVNKYSDCLAKLENGRLMVDQSTGVSAEQIIQWSRNDTYRTPEGWINFIGPHHLYTYVFKYKDENGRQREGRIVFQNTKYADRFYKRLREWAPTKEYKCAYNFDSRTVQC